MPIKVNVSLSAGGQLKPVSSRTLDGAHITIGRDKECSLTLEDTQKHVSRVHAKLDVEAGTYLMTVVSKVNPVMVNGKRHMYEERVALSDGDVLTIGLYKLEILIPPVPTRAAPPPPPPRPPPPPPPPPPPKPVAPPAAAFSEDMTYIPPSRAEAPAQPISAIPDDFSEDMTYVPPSRSRAPAAAPPAASLPTSAGADADATYIPPAPAEPPPDDEVTFVRPASEMTNPLGRASKIVAPSEDVEEDFSEEMTYVRRPAPAPTPPAAPPPPPAAKNAEEHFSEDATYVRRPGPAAPPPAAPSRPPATKEVEEDFSEDATYVRRPGTPAPAPQSVAAPTEELDIEIDFELSDSADLSEEMTLYRPSATAAPVATPPDSLADEPTQYRPRADAAVPAAGTAAPAGGANAERLLQAFLEGAGLDRLEIDDPETFLRDSGATVRAAIEGVMMLLLASTAVKRSLGTETEESSDTNPLKTLSNPAKAIAFLFDPATRTADGPDPVQALGDACSDLRVHQIALMSAMQAAVLTALQSVDPKAVEREHGSSLGGLTLNKKSKLWDLAVAHHEQVTLEVGESINRVFGPEVQAAYAAEVRRIRGGR